MDYPRNLRCPHCHVHIELAVSTVVHAIDDNSRFEVKGSGTSASNPTSRGRGALTADDPREQGATMLRRASDKNRRHQDPDRVSPSACEERRKEHEAKNVG